MTLQQLVSIVRFTYYDIASSSGSLSEPGGEANTMTEYESVVMYNLLQ